MSAGSATEVSKLLLSVAASAILLVVGCGDDDGGAGSEAATVSRSWVEEREFAADASLHASDHQVVLLDLEPAGAGGSQLVDNSFRHVFSETTEIGFCIPDDEPHVTAVEVSDSSGAVVLRSERGVGCAYATVDAGRYDVRVTHHAGALQPDGAAAFVHRVQQQVGESASTGFADAVTSGFFPPNFALPDFMAFRIGGLFVTGATDAPLLSLKAVATSIDEHAVFRFSRNGSVGTAHLFDMEDGGGAPVKSPNCGIEGPIFVGESSAASAAQRFIFWENGNGFELCLQVACSGDLACVVRDSSTKQLRFKDDGTSRAVYTADFKGYDCTTCDASTLPLEEGDVALFAGENFAGPAFVHRADVAQFSIYNGAAAKGLAIGNDRVRSVRVGPNTMAVLYAADNYAQASVTVLEDASSLAGTAVGNDTVSSMHVNTLSTDVKTYVLQSMGCPNCILSGADLSGLDLSEYDFSGARLSGVNFASTSLLGAGLDGASLSAASSLNGTDFADASLRGADFSEANLTGATFGALLGKIRVVDQTGLALVAVDAATGNRVDVSGPQTGSGTQFDVPVDVAIAADGQLYVVDQSIPGVMHVQPRTGARTVLSGGSAGSGPAMVVPAGITAASDGSLLVADRLAQVIRVDPTSGARTLVSGPNRGSGQAFLAPVGVAEDSDGSILVVDRGLSAVLRVSPSSGARTVLSGAGSGSGDDFAGPVDVVSTGDAIYVADLTLPGVWHVDPQSGARTVVSGPNVGSGPSFFNVSGIAVANDGTLVVSDLILGVLVVDPTDGARALLSGDGEGTGPAFEEASGLAVHRTLITDFSSRLDLTAATFDVDTFPLELWRYLDLSLASIEGAEGVELSTVEMPLDLSGVEMNGVTGLSGAILDGAYFGCATPSETDRNCAQLYDAVLNQVSLQETVLSDADMSGIRLIRSNLAAADLSGALLLKSPTTLTAANLQGSYLKDANLANADLSGATLTNANWYSSSPGTCSPAAWAGKCATGEGATLSDTDFSGAYLAGVDLSSSTAQGTKFTGAILAGATFNSANLTGDPNTGASASLAGAFLQGVDFTDAQVGGTDFSSAYVDLTSSNGGTLVWELPSANLSFAGYTPPQTPPNCPFVTYSDQTSVGTLSGNVCPDGNNGENGGSCSMTQWLAPLTPLEMATPPASDELSMLPGDCTALNFNW